MPGELSSACGMKPGTALAHMPAMTVPAPVIANEGCKWLNSESAMKVESMLSTAHESCCRSTCFLVAHFNFPSCMIWKCAPAELQWRQALMMKSTSKRRTGPVWLGTSCGSTLLCWVRDCLILDFMRRQHASFQTCSKQDEPAYCAGCLKSNDVVAVYLRDIARSA